MSPRKIKAFWIKCLNCGLECNLMDPPDQQPDCLCEANWLVLQDRWEYEEESLK